MSFFDDASLIFLPSGQAGKDGKAYSMKPTNGDGDFTFSRGSNLTATRVDSNGLIEKGRENLLLQSNSFDTTWSSSNFTLTSGQSGYDGSNDAWKAAVSTTYNSLSQNFSGSGVYTFSGYFRKGDSNEGIRFNFSASTDTNVYVDLTDGSSTFNGTLIQKSVTDVANGFYRVVVTANLTNPNSIRIFVTNGGTTQVAGNIYIQDAQLEQGLVATEYIESGASSGKAGILEHSPRFDYSGGASCPSLLLEPSRTNLLSNSEYFEDSKLGSVTLTTNAITSPEGVQNASLVVCPSGRLGENVSLTSGTDYVVSVFAKQKGNTFNMRAADGTNPSVEFNLATQTTTDTNGAVGSMEDYGNGWYRCIMKFTASATGSFEIRYVLITDDDGVYAFGAQLEEGSYATSYIPNHSGGSVTREADSCSGAGDSSTFNDTEGVLYAEIAALADDLTFRSISLSDGTNNNRVIIRYRTTTNIINFLLSAGGSVIRNAQHSVTNITDYHKVAIKYKDRDIGIFVDGVKIATYNDTFTLSSLSEVSFTDGSGSDVFYGKPKQVLVFNTALSDVEMITLTS